MTDADKSADQKLARRAAMKYLVRREHSRAELQRKLSARFTQAAAERAVTSLAADGLQSDERTAEQLVLSGVGRGYGPQKLLASAARWGLDARLLQQALALAEVDWRERARLALHKRFGEAPAADLKEKAKRAAFLTGRGFTHEHYRELLRGG